LSRLTQIAPPSTRFVFLGAGLCLGLPSHPASRRRSCLRLGVSTTSSSRGLPPPSDRPCRAYSRRRRSASPLARLLRRALPREARPAQAGPHHTGNADQVGSTASRPVQRTAVFSLPIVPLAATASRAALWAVAMRKPLTRRPLTRDSAPTRRTDRNSTTPLLPLLRLGDAPGLSPQGRGGSLWRKLRTCAWVRRSQSSRTEPIPARRIGTFLAADRLASTTP